MCIYVNIYTYIYMDNYCVYSKLYIIPWSPGVTWRQPCRRMPGPCKSFHLRSVLVEWILQPRCLWEGRHFSLSFSIYIYIYIYILFIVNICKYHPYPQVRAAEYILWELGYGRQKSVLSVCYQLLMLVCLLTQAQQIDLAGLVFSRVLQQNAIGPVALWWLLYQD